MIEFDITKEFFMFLFSVSEETKVPLSIVFIKVCDVLSELKNSSVYNEILSSLKKDS